MAERRGAVEREFLQLRTWDHLSAGMCEAVAKAVEGCLPEPWRFKRLAWHECGDQKRNVAVFRWKRTLFSLIPGGTAALGWDRGDYSQFDPAAIADADSQLKRVCGPHGDVWQYLDEHLAPSREVTVAPFLAEITAGHPADRPEPEDEEEVGATTFRLPTMDEWEYAVGGTCPPGRWFAITGPLSYRQLMKCRPFGLRHTSDTPIEGDYFAEYCYELGEALGGDGGMNEGTGYTGLLGLAPSAAAFRPPRWMAEVLLEHATMVSRRVYPLPPESLAD